MKKCFVLFLLFLTTTLSAIPQAIVFDFGGVMTLEQNRNIVVEFLCETFHLTPSEYKRVNDEKRLATNEGKSYEQFWMGYAKRRDVQLPDNWEQQFKKVLVDAMGVNPEMYVLVEQLKQLPIQVAMLSNIDFRLAKVIRDAGLYEPFEPCLLSYELGISKPDPKIYQILIDTLDMPAKEIVFIDDKLENVEAAKAMGIDDIHFQSKEQLLEELSQRGIHFSQLGHI